MDQHNANSQTCHTAAPAARLRQEGRQMACHRQQQQVD